MSPPSLSIFLYLSHPFSLFSFHTNHRNRNMSLDLREPKRPPSPSPPHISCLESPTLVIDHTCITPSFVLKQVSEQGPPGLFAYVSNGKKWRPIKGDSCAGKGARQNTATGWTPWESDSDSEICVQQANQSESSEWTPVGQRRKQTGQREKASCDIVTTKASVDL